jgi:Relaxase/Mobilisation nuclease domain
MIAKTKANKSFKGTTKYVVDKAKAKIIGGNMYGNDVASLVAEFKSSGALNPKIKDPCYHLMLSVPSTERPLSDHQWAEIGDRHLATIIAYSKIQTEIAHGRQPKADVSEDLVRREIEQALAEDLPAHSYFIAKHEDKDHQHIHIVASRINLLSTKPIRTWHDYQHSELSVRRIEEKYDLTRVLCSWESKHKAMTNNQVAKLHLGLPGEEIIRRAIDEVVTQQPISIPELQAQLWTKHQVRAEVSYYSHGGVRGIKYGIDVGEINPDGSSKLVWKQGNNLNKYKYSFNKLQTELGVSYQPDRDDGLIKIYNQPSQIVPAVAANSVEIVSESVSTIMSQSESQSESQSLSIPASLPMVGADLTPISQSSTPALSIDRQVPSPLNWQKLYQKYSQGLEQLLVTDRDQEIAVRAFTGGYQLDQVGELIATSPVGWTGAEVELIVELGQNQFLERQERERQQLAIEEAQLKQERARVNVVFTPTKSERNYGGISL